ncbi:hypothetical protein EVAR_51153_1 [Eumeta japonica]|uniref:Uncharacterized protein n=1 Tax=Eumeta variegata TaxID=151549 RepID=A0A4C1YKL8_EUMVA|nr:hypothetical protein EVAR_51153_1 [Eumeta japonica]
MVNVMTSDSAVAIKWSVQILAMLTAQACNLSQNKPLVLCARKQIKPSVSDVDTTTATTATESSQRVTSMESSRFRPANLELKN